MRAFVCRAESDDLSGAALEDRPEPVPGPGEVLIAVRAAGVGFPDLLMCQGKYQLRPEPPFIPGMELAGEVAALGPGVTEVAVGAPVVAGLRFGAFAERVVAPVAALRPKPAPFDWPAAASYSASYRTAQVALVRRARLVPGETVLVLGAAGGVGLAACDLAAELGARVIACASTDAKRAFLRDYGVAEVLPAAGFRDAVMNLTGGHGADVVVDPVGGDAFDEAVRAIAFDGRLLSVGFASGRIPGLPVNRALIKGFSLLGVRAGEYARRFPDRARDDDAALAALAAAGRLRPVVSQALPLSAAADALRALAAREVIGRQALIMTP